METRLDYETKSPLGKSLAIKLGVIPNLIWNLPRTPLRNGNNNDRALKMLNQVQHDDLLNVFISIGVIPNLIWNLPHTPLRNGNNHTRHGRIPPRPFDII